MTELKITKEAVLAAAAKCSTAKETLKTLFPEVFEEDAMSGYEGRGCDVWLLEGDNGIDGPRIGLDYLNKKLGFFLDTDHKWEIVNGNYLIPTKK